MHLGSSIIHLPTVDSTNNFAAKLLKEGVLSSGAVILADVQTAGKGQRGAVWEANQGENMLFSLVLRHVNMSVTEQFVLNKIAGLSIVDFLAKFGISAQIKWPNDVLVDANKIAGVLIESSASGSKINDIIIGVGVNINQSSFPGLRATSLSLQLKKKLSVRTSLDELLLQFDYWWRKFLDSGQDEINQAYLSKLIGLNEWREFEVDQKTNKGKITGVDEWGRLIVLIDGEQKVFDLKEIKYCW